jgi:hypothetical protein
LQICSYSFEPSLSFLPDAARSSCSAYILLLTIRGDGSSDFENLLRRIESIPTIKFTLQIRIIYFVDLHILPSSKSAQNMREYVVKDAPKVESCGLLQVPSSERCLRQVKC